MDGNPYEAPQFEPDVPVWRDWFWDAIDRFEVVVWIALFVIGYGLCGLLGYVAAWWFSN